MARGDLAMFASADELNLGAIERAGTLRVRVRVAHYYTREDFTRGAVSLDETREVPVVVDRGLRAP